MAIHRNKIGKMNTDTLNKFSEEVELGLNSFPQTLPSKYFYDEKGDELFVKIMNLPEYYLTRAEYEIFSTQVGKLVEKLGLSKNETYEIIELGAGDGTKTIELLSFLNSQEYSYDYYPIDISKNALDLLENNFLKRLPGTSINKKVGDYFEILEDLKFSNRPKVLLFLGSNLGNMDDVTASSFMENITKGLNKGDKVLLGLDLIKDKSIVIPAYSDNQGVTKDFNLNLLSRINNELGGDFIIENFDHVAEYEFCEGIAKSFLVSKIDQEVCISEIDKVFKFKKGQKINTEISRKYDSHILQSILGFSGLVISGKLTDKNNFFCDFILTYE